MSPRTSGRRRLFGKARKVVKIEGKKFNTVYTMNKVLIHEPPRRKGKAVVDWPQPPVHGPYQTDFDYSPFMPKKSNGRWYPGEVAPLNP